MVIRPIADTLLRVSIREAYRTFILLQAHGLSNGNVVHNYKQPFLIIQSTSGVNDLHHAAVLFGRWTRGRTSNPGLLQGQDERTTDVVQVELGEEISAVCYSRAPFWVDVGCGRPSSFLRDCRR
jgi:hypothetical protein